MKSKFALRVILILSLVVRLISLNQSLWLDEAINVLATKQFTFWGMLTKYSLADFHPPGYFAILWIWEHLFGISEISVRLPSVIFGVATVYLTFLIGKKLFSEKVGLWAALLLAFNPLHLYYSQEARMYSFAAFAAALSFYFFVDLFRGKKFNGWGYALGVILILYSDYLAYFAILAQAIFIFLNRDKQIYKRYFQWLGIGLLGVVPWLLIFPEQYLTGQLGASALSGWKNVVGGARVKDGLLLPIKIIVGRISSDSKFLYWGAVTLAAVPYLIVLIKIFKKFNSFTKLLLCWLLVPPVVALVVSFEVPIFSYFRFIFILPALYLLLAYLAMSYGKSYGKILIGMVVLTEVITSSVYLFNPDFHREDWKDAVPAIEAKISGSGAVVFEDNETLAPYLYYSKKPNQVFAGLDRIPASSLADTSEIPTHLSGKNQVYLFDYLVDITDPGRLLNKRLQELGYDQTKVYNFQGLGLVYEYKK